MDQENSGEKQIFCVTVITGCASAPYRILPASHLLVLAMMPNTFLEWRQAGNKGIIVPSLEVISIDGGAQAARDDHENSAPPCNPSNQPLAKWEH
ncbi:hypothetical protein [Nitrosomonas halophila]|uniref:hypothetical protein n=1 Tax=Nitrosomonas halophila TaxID=44576 RepID=UPI00115FB4DC|nr:hypothetical protein [Nitrosomonas halophila]